MDLVAFYVFILHLCILICMKKVERLINRIQSSTLLEDRRDACRALKALSRKYRMEVGAQGMNVLLNVLATDRGDAEIIGYALDTLCNVMSPVPFEEEGEICGVNGGTMQTF